MTVRATCAAFGWVMFFCSQTIAATDQSLEEAWREVDFLNFDRAISIFEQHVDSGGSSAKEARVGLALALQYRQPDREPDKRRAAEIYDELLATMDPSPTDPAERLVIYLWARMHAGVNFPGDEPNPAEAAALFQRLVSSGTDDVFTEMATAHLAILDISAEDVASRELGIERLRDRLKQQPDHSLAGAHWMMLGNALRFPADDPAGSLEAFERALESGLPAENLIPSVHWRIARLAEATGDQARAGVHYQILADKHKRSLFAHESALALKRLTPTEKSDQPAEVAE